MKHVVNIAFDFDDARVRQVLENSCVDHVEAYLKQAVIDDVFEKRGWGRDTHADPTTDPLKMWVREMIKEMLQDMKEDICRAAAKDIVESMNKSSKWKEKIVEEVGKSCTT